MAGMWRVVGMLQETGRMEECYKNVESEINLPI